MPPRVPFVTSERVPNCHERRTNGIGTNAGTSNFKNTLPGIQRIERRGAI